MAKTAPTVTALADPGVAYDDVGVAGFLAQHQGHPGLTRVGTFADLVGSQPYEVWYCGTEHVVSVF